MKMNLRLMIIFAAFGVIFGLVKTSFAQTEVPVAGGYSDVVVTDSKIVSAANFAVKAQAKKDKIKIKLVAVKKAAEQVVAGTNYKLCLNVETADRQKRTVVPQTVEAIVFKNLKQKFALTSWTIAACTEDAPIAPVD